MEKAAQGSQCRINIRTVAQLESHVLPERTSREGVCLVSASHWLHVGEKKRLSLSGTTPQLRKSIWHLALGDVLQAAYD